MHNHREIYTFEAPWTIYSMGWSQRIDATSSFRLALGSFIEEYSNKVMLVKHDSAGEFHEIGQFEHPYPATKVQWCPESASTDKDLLATTGDYLRLWNVCDSSPNGVSMEALLNNKVSEYCAPLTSFDWNEVNPNLIGTCSIDTTCIIWDIEKQQACTQLIAHDKEVYDIAFAKSKDLFASVGADGSVRFFDMRSLEHSTILFESRDLTPLLRVAWNKQDPNYLATFMADHHRTIVLDRRVPSLPVAELGAHGAAVNAIAWAPHSSCHICTAADDTQALIWDLSVMPQAVEDPILAYSAQAPINQLQWSSVQPDWIAIAFQNKMQLLRV